MASVRRLERSPAPPNDFDRLYRENVEAVMALCAHRGLGPEDAADVCSETFLTALIEFGRFDSRAETTSAWVFRIARAAIRRRSTSNGRLDRFEELDLGKRPALSVADAAEYAEIRDEAARLLASIAGLSASERALLLHQRLDGTDYGELAAVYGASIQTLRKRVHRIICSLRRTHYALDA